MRPFFFGSLLLLAALPAGCARTPGRPAGPERLPEVTRPERADQAKPDDVRAVAHGNNAFAFDLHPRVPPSDGGNQFFSPFSLSTALGMTYAGARGDTAAEMARVLHFPFRGERAHLGYAGLLDKLFGAGKPAGVQLSTANALWGPREYKKDFLSINRDCYAAHLRKIELVGAEPVINAWAEKQTAGRIKNLLAPDTLDGNSVLVLTNAVYFKGEWKYRFQESETRDQEFRTPGSPKRQLPTMHQVAALRYTHTGEGEPAAKVLELPYKGGDLSMVVVLPDADDGLREVEGALTAEKLDGWLARMRETDVRVRLPRFKIEGKTVKLNDQLRALGMRRAFQLGAADFSGMCGGPGEVFIDKAFHQAFVEVNEKGSEAAAATAVIMADKDKGGPSKPREPVQFTADHPFLFLIRDHRTGCILFMGRLNAPK
jgi:serpin B